MTNMQYMLLVGAPTSAAMLGIVVQTAVYKKWSRIHREAITRSEAFCEAILERYKEWEREHKEWQRQWNP